MLAFIQWENTHLAVHFYSTRIIVQFITHFWDLNTLRYYITLKEVWRFRDRRYICYIYLLEFWSMATTQAFYTSQSYGNNGVGSGMWHITVSELQLITLRKNYWVSSGPLRWGESDVLVLVFPCTTMDST